MPAIIRQNPGQFILIAAILLLQLLFIAFFPAVADEAYFVSWGQHPSLGYYDHPPLTGWVASMFGGISNSALLLRLFSLMLGIIMATLLYRAAREFLDQRQALQLLIGWWVLPVNLLVFSQFLNDTLVYSTAMSFVVFSFFSWRNFNQQEWMKSLLQAVIAGFCLGLALLAKYLVALYVIALTALLFVHLKVHWQFILKRLTIIALISAALFSINLYWNYQNCQINLAFNFLHRQPGEPLSGLMELAGSVLFILGPVLFWYKLRSGGGFSALKQSQRFWTPMFALTLAVTALVALQKGHFGLHWAVPLSFLAMMSLASSADKQQRRAVLRGNLIFSAVMVLLTASLFAYVAAGAPGLSEKKQAKLQTTLSFYQDLQNGSVEQQLNDKFAGFNVASSSYSLVGMLGNHQIPAVLLFNVSKYGRNHDIFTDYSLLDGRDFLLFSANQKPELKRYRPYFNAVDLVKLQGIKGEYTLVRARGFDYSAYRSGVLKRIIDRYYSHPLQYSGSCYMKKYQIENEL